MKLNQLLSRIHGFTNDAILVTEAEPIDAPGPRIVFANKAFEELTGYTQDEVVGQTPRILQGEGTCQLALARIRKALENWEPIEEELLNYTKDGKPFWIDISIAPVADETGWFRYWVSVQRDVSKRKLIEKALVEQRDTYRRASMVDDLTGLLNRRGLKDSASKASSHDTALEISLIAIDLDRFKDLNDTLGHDAGDEVLQTVSDRLRSVSKPGDLIARMGGDEFIVLETEPSKSSPLLRARYIQRALSSPVTYGRNAIPCHASVGITKGSWKEYSSGALFRRADLALYAAKAEGRSRAAEFEPDMERRFLDNMALASDLQFALEHGGFSVAYMAKVNAADRKLLGIEALARWNHPVHGDVAPDTFIALAEDLKIVEEIDAFVLQRVAEDRRHLDSKGITAPPISINVSARRLYDDRFLADIERLNLTGKDISVELLETVVLDHVDERTLDTLDKLRWRGIAVEVDDFGSGYASLLSLMQIKPERVKLDRRLIEDISYDMGKLDVVRSALSMATALDIQSIAEGVETEEQADLLSSMGCDALQGFLYGQPSDLEIAVLSGSRNGQRDAQQAV